MKTCLCVVFSAFVHITLAQPSHGSFTLYGPRVFERSTGQPKTVIVTLTKSGYAAPPYILHVLNGAADGTHRVSSATIRLNGNQVCGSSDFNQHVTTIERSVNLLSNNTLEVRLASAPGSYLTLTISAIDTSAPIITVYSPESSLITRQDQVIVSGKVEGGLGVTAMVNEIPMVLAPDGSFTSVVALALEGTNRITFEATSATGRQSEVTRTVIRDTQSPVLTVSTPANGAVTGAATVTVTGTLTDPSPTSLVANTVSFSVDTLGRFSGDVALDEGANTITLLATDAAGNVSSVVLTLRRDSVPPTLAVTSPDDSTITNRPEVMAEGTAIDSTTVIVTVSGIPVALGPGSSFSTPVSLHEGLNGITIVATDAAGNRSSSVRSIRRDSGPPVLSVTFPSDGVITNQTSTAVEGTVTDSTFVTLMVNGSPQTLGPEGSFAALTDLTEGIDTICIVATDAAGNTSTATRLVIRDSEAPTITFIAPAEGFITGQSTLSAEGLVLDSTSVTVIVNGVPSAIGPGGTFATPIALVEGLNAITIVATDDAGNTSSVTRLIRMDSIAPTLTISSPFDGTTTNLPFVTISGMVSDSTALTVTVNGALQTFGPDGLFSTSSILAEGLNTITVAAVDAAGNASTVLRAVRLDSVVPMLTVYSPIDGAVTDQTSVTVTGTATDSTALTVIVNGVSQMLGPDDSFSARVSLVEGLNVITVAATDAAGNTSTMTRTITRQTITGTPLLAAPSNDSEAQSLLTVLAWHPFAGATGDYRLQVALDSNFSRILFDDSTVIDTTRLMTQLNSATTYHWHVNAQSGNVRSAWSNTWHFTTRSDTVPILIVPETKTTGTSIPADANRFIYAGDNKVQFALDTTQLDLLRTSTMRGTVSMRDTIPLSGVKVAILHHPEFGYTYTRADGVFDMVLNGGGLLTVTFSRDGFLSAHRQIYVPWQGYANLDTVVLIQLDSHVTTIDLSKPSQIAFGSILDDQDGSRQAAVVFPQGATATMVLPDGSTRILTSLNVRATEYTTGQWGHKKMPALLPPTSAYTYCVELSVDEAISASANTVAFSHPVTVYVTDFLHFPPGTVVPIGYYDRAKGEWIPSDNGIVLTLISVDDSLAELDLTGDGVPESDSALTAKSISNLERRQMALAYPIGESLWRFQVNHFTAWDANWGVVPPDDATFPDVTGGASGSGSISNDCKQSGSSTIGIQNQTLGESLPLTGTPYSMNYTSERVVDRKADLVARIPLSSTVLPTSLHRIDLTVNIAGKSLRRSFSPMTNLHYDFVWDGKDAYGRWVDGKQPLVATITNVFRPQYGTTSRFGYNGDGTPIAGDRARGELYFSQTWRGMIGVATSPQDDLSGWAIDVHHTYDPLSRTLYLGTGDRRDEEALGSIISSVPGTDVGSPNSPIVGPDGTIYFCNRYSHQVLKKVPDGTVAIIAGTGEAGFSGDGGPATVARLRYPSALDIGRDGSLYICDANYRIRRVNPQGIITTIMGTGNPGVAGDGGLATDAETLAGDVAVAADGSLYVSEEATIRKISTDGIVTTIAGTGEWGTTGDGGPAILAQIMAGEIGVTPDGGLVFSSYQTIRKITPEGMIYTIAGNPEATSLGDGGPATDARISSASGLAVGRDGSVYFSDYYDNRVRVIRPDGTIATIAGNGEESFNYVWLPNGDNGLATAAVVSLPSGIAIGPDEGVYVCDHPGWTLADAGPGEFIDPLADRIRRIAPSFPGLQGTETAIASENGSQVFVFDRTGRHLRTEDALTRRRLFHFVYDSSGYLSSIADRDNLVTRIERDTTSSHLSVVGPFGHRTELALDTQGHVATVTNPAGEVQYFNYTNGGLMTSRLDPRQHLHTYEYDPIGLLVRDQDPAGGFISLSRTNIGNGNDFEVRRTTAEGNHARYRVERPSAGGLRLTNIDGSGIITVTKIGADGSITTTRSDSTSTRLLQVPDPRFGMQSPLAGSLTVHTHGGLESDFSQFRTITKMVGSQVAGLTDSLVFNGHAALTVYDGVKHTFTTTSPEGRTTYARLDTLGRVMQDSVPGILSVRYTYDSLGFLTEASHGGRTTRFVYDERGRLARVTDPLHRTAELFYDSIGRVTREVLADGREIQYAYDANGNLTTLTPPGRPAHGFEYTVVDLTHKYAPPEVPPDSNWATYYTYNLDKQLTRTLLPGGDSIAVRYDTTGCDCGSLSRPAEITFDRGSLAFIYDSVGNVKKLIAPGNDTLSYTYDSSLPTSVRWGGNVNGTVAVMYDSSFRVTRQTINGTDSVAFTYDNDGLLKSAGALTIRRDAANGLFLGDTLGEIVTNVEYNNLGEMSSYEAKYASTPLFTARYQRDSLGRIVTLTETIQGVTSVNGYNYDLAGRLKQVWRNGTLQATYYYDANGNRDSVVTPEGTTRGSYDAQDRLLTYGNASYFYTKRGSLSMKIEGADTTRYTYDLLGNLTKVVLPTGDVIEYLIDGQKRRVGKKLNGRWVQRLLYSTELSPAAELDSADNIITRFGLGFAENGGQIYRVINDHLGSVKLVVNASTGAVVQRMDYDSFGHVLLDTNPGFIPIGYAGGLYDNQTGLERFGLRDYDGGSGRWTAKDPAGFSGCQVNFYSYVNNDPVNLTDPTGLWGPEGHDLMIRHALQARGPSESEIRLLQWEGRNFDSATQTVEESYKHAMAEADETDQMATNRILGFEKEMLLLARRLAQMGHEDLALRYLSRAIHPMMDQTSPAHTAENGCPMVWKGYDSFDGLMIAIEHGSSLNPFSLEGLGSITPDILGVTDSRILSAYSFVFGR